VRAEWDARALRDGADSLRQFTVRTLFAFVQEMIMLDQKDRQKALDTALAGVEKEFGKGAIMRLKDWQKLQADVQVVPTGSIGLDIALGIGGFPRGRIVEIFGPESSGKTSLTLHAVANAQAQGGVAAFIDAEHALDLNYAKRLGVKTDELLISQPDWGEQGLEIADMLVRSNAVDIIVVDSVAALVPKAEIEGDMGDSHVGVQARLMSQALRKLTGTVARSNTLLMFINQMRMKIGVSYGSPETTTGGQALKFYSSVRLDIRRIGSIKETPTDRREAVTVGNRTRVKVVKNKMASPFREVEFDLMYGKGINQIGDLLDVAVEDQLVEKSGAWYSFGGERLGQGRESAIKFLGDHPEAHERVRTLVLAKHDLAPVPMAVTTEAATPAAEPSTPEAEKAKRTKR